MKNAKYLLLAALLPVFAAAVRAEDKYETLAKEISEAGADLGNKKIAIMPFSYADGREAAKDGANISEEITMRMIKQRKFEIIERSVLDKVMGELKLQASGMMDAASTKQLGKVLGVEAIVTGTLMEMQGGQIKVNARLIKTETAQAIGASQVTVTKDWVGDAATAPAQPVYQGQQPAYMAQQPSYQQAQPAAQPAVSRAPARAAARARGQYEYGYFDIFFGGGSPNMALEFYNSNRTLRPSHVGITHAPDSQYYSIKTDKLENEGFAFGMRVGGYGNGNVGGAFEFGLDRRKAVAQTTDWNFDGAIASKTNNSDGYLTLTSINMIGNLMVRFAKKTPVEPYFGLGLGLSINVINMPSVYGYTGGGWGKPTDDVGIGFIFNVPVGARMRIGDNTLLTAEYRYQLNTMTFDRGGVAGERDVLTVKGGYFNAGLGFTF
jgi:TolB-like protein